MIVMFPTLSEGREQQLWVHPKAGILSTSVTAGGERSSEGSPARACMPVRVFTSQPKHFCFSVYSAFGLSAMQNASPL